MNDLKNRIGGAAIAFRGYNITNLGKTPELLRHRVYGPTFKTYLDRASEISSETLRRRINLEGRVRRRAKTTLNTYAQDIAMILAVELAQLKVLDEFHGISTGEAKTAFGFSLGEMAALVSCGVYDFETVLIPLLKLADDTAELAVNVKMGILFSRGPALDFEAVARLCLTVTSEGKGTVAVSSYLSPNSVLLIGQGRTVDRFKKLMHEFLPETVHLRKNEHRWPPIHTPITRQRNIPDRAAVMLEAARGGFTAPKPPILSFVTGDAGYNDYNSRLVLRRWTDHPQRVWDVIDKSLAMGINTIVHVGPEPNILPATYSRLSNNIKAQLSGRTLANIGLRAMSRMVRRPWLTSLLSSDATLLRAPFVEQVVLEDWLLEQGVDKAAG